MVQVKTLSALEKPSFVRIKFKKTGKMQYISHLDLVRTMHKMLIRARMPLYFTEGFNPKPKMVFASSMSIGLQSVCEFLDVKITHDIDMQSAIDSLNTCSTSELVILDVYFPKTEFAQITWAEYEISINEKKLPDDISQKCEQLLKSSPLEVLKRTKSGDRIVDISDTIGDVKASISRNGELVISILLRAENTSFLNPEYIITLLKNKLGILSGNLLENIYSIIRVAMYDAEMKLFK